VVRFAAIRARHHPAFTCVSSAGDGGPPTSAALSNPMAIAVDSTQPGSFWIADSFNHRVRKVAIVPSITQSQTLSPSPTTTPSWSPTQSPTPTQSFTPIPGAASVVTLAGGGANGSVTGSTDGVGTAALFSGPLGVAINAAGTFGLIIDSSRVRRVEIPSGAVSTVAGRTGVTTAPVDGIGSSATFAVASAVALDAAGTFAIVVRVEFVLVCHLE
jgi:hypothetical protein